MKFLFDLGGIFFNWDPVHFYKDIFSSKEEMNYFLNKICNDDWNLQQDSGRTIKEAESELISYHPKYKEEIKMYYLNHRKMIKNTYKELSNKKNPIYDFCGYIEGNQIMEGDTNVIVTDGFTGNIALKTAEGTANFLTKNLKISLNKLSMLLSYYSLKKFKERLDPRKYNGAILLGLQGPVVKSHGATDYIGFAYSIEMCNKIVKSNLIEKIKTHLIDIDH